MKSVLRTVSLFALVSLLPAARAADVSGTWKGAFDYQGKSFSMTMNLKVTGNGVTGTLIRDNTPPSEIHDGALSGDTLTFWVNTDYEGTTYKIVYKGKVSADQIVFDFGTEDGSWSAPLTVKRSDVAAAPAAPSSDVSGNWKGSFDLNGTPTQLTFRLKSTANTVTGTMEREGVPPAEIHDGKVEGGMVSFWINTDYQGQTYTITYKGKVTADKIDFDFGTADQNWGAQLTAKRVTDATAAAPAVPASPAAADSKAPAPPK